MEVSLHLQICKILWHLFFPKSRHHVEGTEEFATASILRIAVISEYLGCHNFSVEGRCQKTIFSEFRLLPKLHPSRSYQLCFRTASHSSIFHRLLFSYRVSKHIIKKLHWLRVHLS